MKDERSSPSEVKSKSAPQIAVQNFLNKKINLDVMTYLSMGLKTHAIAEKIRKPHSFVQSRSRFLKDHQILVRGQWNVDVRALGMTKTIEFYDYTEKSWNEMLERRFFLSFLSEIVMEEQKKYLAMYTFPEDVKNRTGSEISSWYYTFPHFTLPFFKNRRFQEMFWKILEEETNENPLPPRGERIENPDLIDIYICRYVQTDLEDVNLKEYTRRMEEEIGDLIDVQYSVIQKRFHKLREKNVIYPVNPISLTEALYTHFFCITSYNELFRFMKALNRLNVMTAISFGKDDRNILYIHGPHNRQQSITKMLTELDSRSTVFSITNLEVNRGLPYGHYLEKCKKDCIVEKED